MKDSLTEMLRKHDLEGQEKHREMLNLYHSSRAKWTKENGSCLDAPDYYEHWDKREDYIQQMLCLWYKKEGLCKGCKDLNYKLSEIGD